MTPLLAGSASRDITPQNPLFLFGYPHVARTSEGVHDPLLTSALYLSDGASSVLFCANDIIFVPADMARRARRRIAAETGVPASAILVSATHTHSGPITSRCLSNALDPVVPAPDTRYLAMMEERIVECCVEAVRSAREADAAFCVTQVRGTGTNRHDPAGPADPEVPVLVVRAASDDRVMACMVVHAMHPTVLHEDSRLVSGDFIGLARPHMQKVLGPDAVVLVHNGASGNQSPRHVTRGNTFDEAARLAALLADGILGAVGEAEFMGEVHIAAATRAIDGLQRRDFPAVGAAEEALADARARLEGLRKAGAPRPEVRTAECDWFGAEETVALAKAAGDRSLDRFVRDMMPVEVQAFRVGPWRYVGWPGEFFVEYALELRAKAPLTYLITMANGDLQGYITTEDAVRQKSYEAGNALFPPSAGRRILDETLELVKGL